MDVNELLIRIIDLLPNLVRALDGVGRWAGAVSGFSQRLLMAIQALITAFLAQRIGAQAALVPVGAPPITVFQQFVQWFARTGFGQAVAGFIANHYQGVMTTARFVGAAVRGTGQMVGGAIAGAGAFAASPLGQVAVVAAGVAAALVGLGVAAERLGRSLLESQRHLADSSAAMAVVFAQSDVRRVMREMRAGNEQAGTAGFLARGIDNLADALQPILSLLANIGNVLGGLFANIMAGLITPITLIVEYFETMIELVKLIIPSFLLPGHGDPKTMSQFLDAVQDEARGHQPVRGLVFP